MPCHEVVQTLRLSRRQDNLARSRPLSRPIKQSQVRSLRHEQPWPQMQTFWNFTRNNSRYPCIHFAKVKRRLASTTHQFPKTTRIEYIYMYIYNYIYNYTYNIYIYTHYIYKSVWDCCRYFSQTQTWTHSTASGHEVAAWCWAVHLPGYRKAWTGLEV